MKIPVLFRVLVSLGFLVWGFWAAAWLPHLGVTGTAEFYSALALKIAGILFAVLTMLLRNDVVFRKGWLWWRMSHLARHVVIIGDTGAGKTLGGMNFLFREFMRNVPTGGAFVVGTKGDEPAYALNVCKHMKRAGSFRCLEVRPDDAPPGWKPPELYNLVSDRSLPWTTHAKAIVDTASANTEGHQSSFFKPAAQEGIAFGLHLLDSLGRPVNLRSLRDLLTSEENLRAALADFGDVAASRTDPGDIRLTEYFEREFISAKGRDQSAGLVGTIGLYLAPFQTPEIAEVFCSEQANTLTVQDFDKGMVLATSIPQRFYSERLFIHTYLKTLVYFHALRRLDKSSRSKRAMNPIGCFVDEFQDVVTASEDGMADHKVADRIRSGKVFIVAAMQSEFSPDPKIGDARRKVLMKQFRTRFYFRVPDEEDAKCAADFIGKKLVRRRYRAVRGVMDFEQSSTQEELHRVRTDKFVNLPDFTAYVVHPSPQFLGSRYRRSKMPPIDPDGKVAAWYGAGRLLAKGGALLR